jgi:predicted AlkP superfamily pyrophosphatase or phosphodiesterase
MDTIRFPHDKQSEYIHQIDDLVVHQADSTIRVSAPDLSWVYLEYTDDMGHKYGDGEKMEKAIEYLDIQMGQLWDAIQYRKNNFAEDWLIIITTDHGRDAATGKNHGGQSERERRTWIVTNSKKTNKYFKENEPAIVDILPSIASFMRIDIPEENKNELDGVSFLGPISISHPKLIVEKDSLIIQWKSYEKKGQVKVLLSNSNQFKEGKLDAYQQISVVPISQNKFVISTNAFSNPYYKIVLQGNKNSINTEIRLTGLNK